MTQHFITIATMKTLRRGRQGMGTLSSDETYITNGHYPLVDVMPEYDSSTKSITSELVVDEANKVVNRVYTITDKTQAELDAEFKATVPSVITMRQARLALLGSNLLAAVTTAITSGTDEALKIEWEYSTECKRDWQSLITMATALGMTDLQLDELFILGATL
jgi:hypothetical protein